LPPEPGVPEISTAVSLIVVGAVLAVTAVASLIKSRRDPAARAHAGAVLATRPGMPPAGAAPSAADMTAVRRDNFSLDGQIAAGGRATQSVREYRRPCFPNGLDSRTARSQASPVPGRPASWRERPRDVGPRPDGWKFTERIAEFRYLDTTSLAGPAPAQRGTHAQ
jgi:hypothetical protein